MVPVFLKEIAIDLNINEVDHTELVQVFTENIVNKVLEGTQGIGKAEPHNGIFKKAVLVAEFCLSLFSCCYAVKVKCSIEV